MSFLGSDRSGLLSGLFGPLPKSYESVAPHHVLGLYAVYGIVRNTPVVRKLTDKILNLLSKTTDILIPLVYAGVIPGAFISCTVVLDLVLARMVGSTSNK